LWVDGHGEGGLVLGQAALGEWAGATIEVREMYEEAAFRPR
jgi:hypothetical protein